MAYWQLRSRRGMSAGAGVLLALGAAACSSGSPDGLTVSGLHEKALAVPKGTLKACPLSYDVGKAAGKAKVSGSAALRPGPDSVTVDTPENSGPGSAAKQNGATFVECDYRVGRDDVTVYTVGAENGHALEIVLPIIQRDGELGRTGLESYDRTAGKAKPGTATLTSTGTVATVRLPGSGKGNVVLVVSAAPSDQNADKPAIAATQLGKVAEELAAQTRW